MRVAYKKNWAYFDILKKQDFYSKLKYELIYFYQKAWVSHLIYYWYTDNKGLLKTNKYYFQQLDVDPMRTKEDWCKKNTTQTCIADRCWRYLWTFSPWLLVKWLNTVRCETFTRFVQSPLNTKRFEKFWS